MTWRLLLIKARAYAVPILSVLLAAGGVAIWYHGYSLGKTVERSAHQSAIEVERAKQARLVDELEAAQAEQRVVYRDRVRVVEREADPSGCADVAPPDGVLRALGYRRD